MEDHSYPARCLRLLAVLAMCLTLFPSAGLACSGDCNGDDAVDLPELVVGLNVALGKSALSECGPADESGDGGVSIDEVVKAIDASLHGCPEPVISTVAGTGLAGLNEDGLDPLQTYLYLPQDTTVGPDGRLYIVDFNNHRIRRIRDGVIETVAGTGELGDGEDGPALYAQFNHPTNVTFDHQGNMIIAAWHNSLVKRLVFPNGYDDVTTGYLENLAGTGGRSFGGDGGLGNQAILDLPSSVVVDSVGNIIISDQANFVLRQLEPNGIIDTICGMPRMPGYAGDGGPAIDAQLDSPKGQAADPAGRIAIDDRDRIYIADTSNNRIRMIDPGTYVIHTIAGTGDAGYSGDGGPATEAELDTPSDVAVGPNGRIYIADTMNHAVRVIRPDGTIHTLAGTGVRGFSGDGGPANQAELDRPFGVEVTDNGTVYVADTYNHRIRKVSGVPNEAEPTPVPTPPEIIPCTDEVGSICTYVGTGGTAFNGDGRDRRETVLYWPFDIEFTSTGRRVVLDWNNHRVREILPDETLMTIVGTDGLGDGPFDLSDLSPQGAVGTTVRLNHPTDVVEFSNGDLALMAWHNHKIREIDGETGRVFVLMGRGAGRTGDDEPLLTADETLVNQPPHGAFDSKGNFFFIDQRNERIRVAYNFDTERKNALVRTVVGDPGDPATPGYNGDGPALQTRLNFPSGGNPEPSGGIAIDANDVLYFSDSNNNLVRKVEFTNEDFTEGQVTTIAGVYVDEDEDGIPDGGYSGDGGPGTEAMINFPEDLEIGPDGNLYFADANNNRVRMIDLTTGVITTVAGNGNAGYSGDGGPALDAELHRPFGVAFDENGDLYVSDTFNSRIRKVKR